MDLKLVRLLRDAIRTADLAGGKVGPLGTLVAPQPSPRHRVEPEPKIEPRLRHEPEPRFDPRPLIRPRPRVEFDLPVEAEPSHPRCPKAPRLLPPWRTPWWEIPSQPAPVIKLHIHQVDVISKGSLIDLFC
jgi:hypothetical protein